MIYVKTELGQQEVKSRTAGISPRQRSAFILIDGKHETCDVLKSTAGIGVSEQDIDHLLHLGLIKAVPTAAAPQHPAANDATIRPIETRPATPLALQPPTPSFTPLTPQELYLRIWPLATQLTAGLGLWGFRLNLAVERAGSYEELMAVLPRIRAAVGVEKFKVLEGLLRH